MATLKLISAFLGCGMVSFLLFYVMLKQRSVDSVTVIKNKDKKGMKKIKEELKQEKWSWQNLIMSKWVAFGGGFYGVMSVLTYVVVEFMEVVDLITSEQSIMATIAELGISDLFSFFINSIMNFVIAIVWPVYWMKNIEGYSVWVWFCAVYIGYVVGQYLAKNISNPYAKKTQ